MADWRVIGAYLLLAAILVVAIVAVAYALNELPNIPEIRLPVLLIGGVALFLVTLMIFVIVLARLKLTDPTQAFGMPEGTIRAMIALSLILIFSITSIHLYSQLRERETSKIEGLTREQLDAIPGQLIIATRPQAADPSRYDVLVWERNETSEDFAQQILTTISTLVVAVAGFYFGTTAVAAARGAMAQPTLRILRPDSPATMKLSDRLLIRLETAPAGMAIIGEVDPAKGRLIRTTQYDEFEYAPTDAGPVTLTFSLVAHPEVSRPLEVTVSK